VLKDEASLRRALPKLELEPEDQKLVGLRIVPFANQLVSTQVSIDHNRLNWICWRAAALVFLMGSLATITVVLVSRNSEIRLRPLNGALLRESRTDGLTRIANRRAWDESLNLEESRRQRHGHQIGLVVVDLDGFKQINDEQGHQMGDQVLKIAASRLGDQMRSTDLLARVGGDEFALMVFNPSAAGLDELVDRLREALKACGVQASIGAAMSEPRTTLEQTWAKADEAMYTYKPQTSKKLNPRRAIDQSGHRA
jgi:diguanylate cyclase (GGDEF)-like protein